MPASLDLSVIDAEYLSQFDGVMMMTNGNLPLTDSQKSALIDFVKDGGGFIGVHCAAFVTSAPACIAQHRHRENRPRGARR